MEVQQCELIEFMNNNILFRALVKPVLEKQLYRYKKKYASSNNDKVVRRKMSRSIYEESASGRDKERKRKRKIEKDRGINAKDVCAERKRERERNILWLVRYTG